MNALILLSGGIDSTCCLHFFKQQGFNCHALFVDYDQPSAKKEREATKKICSHYSSSLEIVEISTYKTVSKGEIRGRNLMLLSLAFFLDKFDRGIIALGIHSGTPYIDCSSKFLDNFQKIIDLYHEDRFKLEAPFINFTKSEIWHYAKKESIPLELTYSCELGLEQPCGNCASCLDLIKLNEN